VVVAVAIVLSAVSGFYVDLLWFREVHFSSVFWSVFWSKLVLGVIFGAIFFSLLLANLWIVNRLTPKFRPFSPEQEVIERYRAAVEPYLRWLVLAFAGFIALLVGLAAAAQWQTFLIWRSAGSAAFASSPGHPILDPVFHRNPAFYVFILPFYKFVQGWLFESLVGVTVISGVAHYLAGGIRLQAQPPAEKVTPQVKAHLSVLLGLIVLAKAWGYYLGKFDLLVSPRGVVTGASYTDIHAQLPALKLLVFIAIACAILFLVNIRFRGWALPILGIGLLALTSIVAGGVVPAFVQKFRVAPQEVQKETPFIQRTIAGTRFAFGIGIRPSAVTPAFDVTTDQINANTPTIENIRLWSPLVLKDTYDAQQRIQQYYEFSDVDVDRYNIDGQERMVMLSAREVSQNGVPGTRTWQSSHLIYTHGYGAVASRVNTASASGGPDYILQDIPPIGSGISLSADHGSQVYYGDRPVDVQYLVVDTKQKELNYPAPNGPGTVSTRYQGKGGIPIGGFFRRLVFAYRYRDINLLISGLIDSDSRILINRDVRARVQKAAPFLQYDSDPYAAIAGGHLFYIWDAYATTDLYPYSERVDLGDATNDDLSGTANYIRNSVKAVVDAYDGTVTFYVVDPSDPVIQVWENAFPALFTPVDLAPAELQAHFRYPEDLLQVQATEYARYHVTDPQTFFNNSERWAVPSALSTTVGQQTSSSGTLRPYYVLTKLPGDVAEQFVLFQPFTPFGRPNQMVSYLAAGSDPGQYGKLTVVQFPPGENVSGPSQVRSLISQDPTVSQQITLLNREGSTVQFGDLIVVPVEDGFIYVQPIFVTASGNPIPELKRVVVVHGNQATIANSLSEAIASSFGQQPPPPGGGGAPPPTGQTVDQLLAQALQHFQAAEAALKAGDLATYQTEIEAAQALVQQAEQLAKSGGTTASPSPTPTPSASPSG
jgi:uncharacterized protein